MENWIDGDAMTLALSGDAVSTEVSPVRYDGADAIYSTYVRLQNGEARCVGNLKQEIEAAILATTLQDLIDSKETGGVILRVKGGMIERVDNTETSVEVREYDLLEEQDDDSKDEDGVRYRKWNC